MESIISYLESFHHQFLGNEESDKKLVFLHGLMGYGANWRTVAKSFESDYHILYYDQRGHGRSISPSSGYAPEDFAGDLEKILDELGWDEIYLVGHSMGGRIVATFAYLHPDRVIKLVIEDIGPEANKEAIAKIEALLDGIPSSFADKKSAREYFKNDFPNQFSDRPQVEALGQFLYSNFGQKDSGEVTWKFDIEAMRSCVIEGRSKDRFDQFAALSMPTLLVRGKNSPDLSKEVYLRVLNENSNIKGVEIADSGHWVHFDQVEKFTAELMEFLTD